ncbi:hypothetical protein LXL04_034260 [Taraxacum kok-saghyz]
MWSPKILSKRALWREGELRCMEFLKLPINRFLSFWCFHSSLTVPPSDGEGSGNPSFSDQLEALIHLTTANCHRLDTISNHLTVQSTNLTKQTETLSNLVHFLTIHPAQQPPHGRNQPPPPPPPANQQPRPPKINLPTFDGSNPFDWMFQAENYFSYYAIPPQQRLALAVFYSLAKH